MKIDTLRSDNPFGNDKIYSFDLSFSNLAEKTLKVFGKTLINGILSYGALSICNFMTKNLFAYEISVWGNPFWITMYFTQVLRTL